jgi:hypothetical protein
VETGPNDYLENLDLFLMVSGEARKNKWSIWAPSHPCQAASGRWQAAMPQNRNPRSA